MENELVPNSVTLTGLRRLLEAARKKAGPNEAVYVGLPLWSYSTPIRIVERIEVYRSGTGRGSSHFKTLREAHKHIAGWKEGTDAATS